MMKRTLLQGAALVVCLMVLPSRWSAASTISYVGNLRTDATVTSCGSGCTLDAGNTDAIATNYPTAVGPTTGTLGITTLTNFDTSRQQVYLFQPVLSGTGCYKTIVGTVSTGITLYVQPGETLVVPYPSSWKISPALGNTCFGSEVTTVLHGGSVEVDVNGIVN